MSEFAFLVLVFIYATYSLFMEVGTYKNPEFMFENYWLHLFFLKFLFDKPQKQNFMKTNIKQLM